MQMCYLVSVDNTQSEARNACVLHLSLHIRINLCKIGSGFRLHTWCSLNRKHHPGYCKQAEQASTAEGSVDAYLHKDTPWGGSAGQEEVWLLFPCGFAFFQEKTSVRT